MKLTVQQGGWTLNEHHQWGENYIKRSASILRDIEQAPD